MEEETEWKAIMEHPDVKEFRTCMAKPPPQVRDALCKQCGEHVIPVKDPDMTPPGGLFGYGT